VLAVSFINNKHVLAETIGQLNKNIMMIF